MIDYQYKADGYTKKKIECLRVITKQLAHTAILYQLESDNYSAYPKAAISKITYRELDII